MKRAPHILFVEDDRDIRDMVAQFLTKNGLRVSTAADGTAMDRALADRTVNLVLLDLMLPGEDGLSLCRRLRAATAVPIIIVTAMGQDIDRIVGLETGADDYVTKPFNPRELLARIRAVLRRTVVAEQEAARPAQTLTFAGWKLDALMRQLENPDGTRVALTSAEFDLLLCLCLHPRRVLNRDQLLDLTHGRTSGPFDRSIDVMISRIRQKIEDDPRDPKFIKTVRLEGYIFTPEVTRA